MYIMTIKLFILLLFFQCIHSQLIVQTGTNPNGVVRREDWGIYYYIPYCKTIAGKCSCILKVPGNSIFNTTAISTNRGDPSKAIDGQMRIEDGYGPPYTSWWSETHNNNYIWWRIELPYAMRVMHVTFWSDDRHSYKWRQVYVGNESMTNFDAGFGSLVYCTQGQHQFDNDCDGGGMVGKFIYIVSGNQGYNNLPIKEVYFYTEIPRAVSSGSACACATGYPAGISDYHANNAPVCLSCPQGSQWDGTKCRCSQNYYCTEDSSTTGYVPTSINACPANYGSYYRSSTVDECNFCVNGSIISNVQSAILDSSGNPVLDGDGNPTYTTSQVCSPCAVGFYCPNNSTQLPCPPGTTSEAGQAFCTIPIPFTSNLFGSTYSSWWTPWGGSVPVNTQTWLASSGDLDSQRAAANAFDGNFATGAFNNTFSRYWQSSTTNSVQWLRLSLNGAPYVGGGYVLNWFNPAQMRDFEIWVGNDVNFPGSNYKCYQSVTSNPFFVEKFTCGRTGAYLFFARSVPNNQFLSLGEIFVYTNTSLDGNVVPQQCTKINNYCGCSYTKASKLSGKYLESSVPLAQDNNVNTFWGGGSAVQTAANPVWLRMDFESIMYVVGGVARNIDGRFTINFEIWIGNDPTLPGNNFKCYQSESQAIEQHMIWGQFQCQRAGRYLYFARSLSPHCGGGCWGDGFRLSEWTIYTGNASTTSSDTCTSYGCALNSNQVLSSDGSCVTCPSYTNMSYVNFRCECPPGYIFTGSSDPFEEGNSCRACAAGYRCSSVAETICQPGSFSLAAQSTCTACSSGTFQPDAGQTFCTNCTAGYACNSTGFVPCNIGSFSKETSSACTTCSINTYAPVPISSSCFPCQTNSFSAAGSSFCTCKSGFLYLNGVSGVLHTDGSCESCPGGNACPNNSTQLLCQAGTFAIANSTVCTSCAINTYTSSSGSTACTLCPALMTTLSKTGSISISNCTCGATSGYYRENNQCFLCPAEHYCINEQKYPCGPSTFTWNWTGQTKCYYCTKGFYLLNGVCTVCPFDNFCTGNDVATPCSGQIIGYKGASMASECVNPDYSPQCTYFQGQCACKFDRTGVTINSRVGTGNWWGTEVSHAWDNIFYTIRLAGWSQTDAPTWIGWTLPSPRLIVGAGIMVADNQAARGANFQLWVGNSTVITENVRCYISPRVTFMNEWFSCGVTGKYIFVARSVDGSCDYCEWFGISEANFYTPSTSCTSTTEKLPVGCGVKNYYNTTLPYSPQCSACPTNTICNDGLTTSPLKSGYYTDGQYGYKCTQCTIGKYRTVDCTTSSDATCVSCPENFTSSLTATSIDDCRCLDGYLKYNTTSNTLACRACTAGYRCPSSTQEIICPSGSFSASGASVCTTCAANSYAEFAGSSTCTNCPANSASSAGSNAKSLCNCVNGYYRDVNLNCIICPSGYRCTGNTMTACGIGTSSAIGSSACTLCEQGTYSDRVGLPGCISCPNGKIVVLESNVEIFNQAKIRANSPSLENVDELYIQRMQLPTSNSRFNITKFTFYATQACTITPVLFQSMAAIGLGGYQNVNMQPMVVGTTRTVPGAGKYSYDFLQGSRILSKQYTLQSGSLYNNLEYLGWYFTGPACIPYDIGAASASIFNDYVVSVHTFNQSQSILLQNFPNNVDLGAPKKNTMYSISLNYSITVSGFATTSIGSTSIFNCSCGAGLRTLSDGNCQGLCVDGTYMRSEEDETCTICPQGSYCVKSVNYSCPTQKSSPPQSGQCFPCIGPDTHSDVSLVMCGLKTCPAASLVSLGTTGWQGVGQISIAQGGNGVIPTTHWYSADRCLGLMLNATADRPVSLIQQTLSVTIGKTYAIRFKYVCTGSQCGANFKVTWLETSTVFTDLTFVKRSWVEEATAYFTPTSSSVTIQFRAEMVTSSCSIWLARVQLVDLGRWSYSSIGHLHLKTGVDLPNRYSKNYVTTESFVLMDLAAGGYIEQVAGMIVGVLYELKYWHSGSVVPSYYNGTAYVSLTPGPPYDTAVGYSQAVYYVVPTFKPIMVRFTGPGKMSKPVLQVYTPLDDSPCKNCLNDYWCAGATLNRCPLNTISNNGSRAQTDCYCKPGYYGIVQNNSAEGYSPCALCLMNRYCSGGNHIAFCPPGTKSMPGADLSGCYPCAEGEYCMNGQVGICPMNSWSPSGSDEIEDCSCQPGYYGTRGNCVLCEVGFYCPGSPTRYACTANAISPIGSVSSQQCFCDRGYYGVNNTPCTVCQEGYWCWTGIRNLCPPNMWSPLQSSYQNDCICEYGYTGPNGGPCTSCSTGHYKNSRGTATCAMCVAGTRSEVLAATSVDTCASCGHGQYNMYAGQSACTSCDAGTATNQFGSTVCATCVAGKWSPQAAATCSNCLAGTYSTTIGASSISFCLTCQPGSYSSAGSTVCLLCGACSYWNWPMRINFQFTLGAAVPFASVGANAGSMMTLETTSVAIVNDVSDLYRININTGTVTAFTYEKRDTTAISHLETSMNRNSLYMVQNNYAYRFSLPEVQSLNSYGEEGIGALGITESAWGNSVWITCSTNMKSYNKDTEALLSTVQYPSPFTLVTTAPCVHTSYPNEIFVAGRSGQGGFGFRKYNFVTNTWAIVTVEVTSLNKCEFTPDGLFVFLTSSSNTWVWNMLDSTMTRFYVGQVNGMIIDPNQEFVLMARQLNSVQKQSVVIRDPRNCPQAQYNLLGGLQSASECITCPAGSLCPGGAVITQCSAGTYSQTTALREQGQCTSCPAGFYCTGGTGFQVCPLGSYSLNTGVTKVQDCPKCPAGFYCTNVTSIEQCPPNTNSPMGSSDLAQCVCDPGYKCEVTKVVHAEVTLPISVIDFEALRQQYILAVASAAGVDPTQVVIVSVTSATPSSGRRLLTLTRFCEVHTSIYRSHHHAAPHLAFKDLGKHLVAHGLPHHHKEIRVTLHHEITHSRRR